MKAIIGLAFMLLSFPAFAQDVDKERFLAPETQLGTRFKQHPESPEIGEGREMQKRIVRCMYYGDKKGARRLLAHSDFSRIDFEALERDPEELFDDFEFGRCIERAMKHSTHKMYVEMRYDTFRNLLAEEVYLRDNKVAPSIVADAPVLLTNRYRYENLNPRSRVMAEVADCISYYGYEEGHALLKEVPGSDGEREALQELGPVFVMCLGRDDKTEVSVTPSMARQLIADAMWSRSHYGSTASRHPVEPKNEAQ